MQQQSYYRNLDGMDKNLTSNYATTEVPLLVNCTGLCSMNYAFETYNRTGRIDYYLLYLYSGELTVWIAGAPQAMQAGQLIFFSPRLPYRYANPDNKKMEYFWIHFTGNCAETLLSSCGFQLGMPYSIGIDEQICGMFNSLFREFIRRDLLLDTSCAAILTNICVHLRRRMDSANKREQASVLKSLEFLNENYHREIAVASLAKMENLSCSRYRTVFRSRTGLSPMEYVTNLRIQNACKLLLQTDLSFKEIAVVVGYGDPLYFSRVFKKKVGVSPKAYKENKLKECIQ